MKNSSRSFTFTDEYGKSQRIELGDEVPGVIDYMAAVSHTNERCRGCRMFLFRNQEEEYYLHYGDCFRVEKGSLGKLYGLKSITSTIIASDSEGTFGAMIPCHREILSPQCNIEFSRMRTLRVTAVNRLSNSAFFIPVQESEASCLQSLNTGVLEILEESYF